MSAERMRVMLCHQFEKVTCKKLERDVITYVSRIFIITVFVVLAHSPSIAKADVSQEQISINDVTQGTLLLETTTQNTVSLAPSLHTNVHISITGLIARTTVRQEFRNPGTDWAEGIYVFPLPETAAVDHLRMHIGERIIEGMIQKRAEAKNTYTKAKQEGRRASLIEQERPNMFTTSIANIGPNERITIEIEYQETVQLDHGQFSFRFPMVIGPRYIPGSHEPLHDIVTNIDGHGWARNTRQVPDASRITPHVQHPEQGPLNPVTLSIDLSPGFPLAQVTSTYHDITQTKKGDHLHEITLKDGTVPTNRDFELTWQPKQDHAPQAAFFTEQNGGETYMLLMVMPPTKALADHVTMPRDVTFVIDTSGSMHGTSMEQAKSALHLALTQLKSQDRFNIIQFHHETHALFSSSQPVTSQRIQEATGYVHRLVADGGTEMLPALLRSLQHQHSPTHLRQVIFVTDGQIGNEKQLFQSIQQHLEQTRLFTVGIGSSPNSYFMRNAAKFGRGTFTYIGTPTEVQHKMDQLFQKLVHPAITDIKLELLGTGTTDIVPQRIPDLYLGEPVMVAIRSSTLPNQVTVNGKRGLRKWDTTVSLNSAPQREGIAVYWARQKIATLMENDTRTPTDDIRQQKVTEIALAHHLVSRYTSLVAVDVTPNRPSDQTLSTHAMKTNLPHGQDYTAIFGLAAGATPGPWHLTLGFLLMLIASAGYQWTKSRI